MTWGDVKLIVLQRIFAVTGDEIIYDDTTMPYLKSMPAAANEGLQLLSTAGKFIVKSIGIVQDGTGELNISRYNMKEKSIDFYSFKENQIYFDDGIKYDRANNYSIEGNCILVLDTDIKGKWTVYYNSYPDIITKNTADNTKIEIDDEVAVLLPLYIASQLYKDDDMGQSVQFRNEFEAGREMLRSENNFTFCHEEFKSVTGWW